MELEKLLKELSDLTTALREKDDDPTVDTEALHSELAEVSEGIQALQAEMNKPARLAQLQAETGQHARMIEWAERVRTPYPAGAYAGATPADLWLAEKFMDGVRRIDPERVPEPSDAMRAEVQGMLKAAYDPTFTAANMDPSTSGFGAEVVPDDPMTQALWEDMFLETRVAQALGPPIQMVADAQDVGLALGDPTWHKGTAGSAFGGEKRLATSKKTLTVTELLTEVNWTYNMSEEAVIAMMPSVRQSIVRSGAEQIDSFLINADGTDAATGNINLDDADPDATEPYLSNGEDDIRHLFLVDNTGQGVNAGGDALAAADMTSARKNLEKYGLDPSRCMWIPDVVAYAGMLGLDGVKKVHEYGPNATLLTGELAQYEGIPVLPSGEMPQTEADGKKSTTAANNTLGQIALLHRLGWKWGQLRGLQVEVDRNIQTRQFIMVGSTRIAVVARGTRSSAVHTAGIYNIL